MRTRFTVLTFFVLFTSRTFAVVQVPQKPKVAPGTLSAGTKPTYVVKNSEAVNY